MSWSYLPVYNEAGEFDMRLRYEVPSRCCSEFYEIDLNKPTLLHDVDDIKDLRTFLSYGAQVNGLDENGCTPLMYAVEHDRGMKFVRELLKYGADVNKQNYEGDTALNIAVRKGDFLSTAAVIHKLLEHGADINIRNSVGRLHKYEYSSLDNAVHNPHCAKLLIKMTLLQNFDKNYRDMINLTPYKSWAVFSELSNFLEDCIREVTQMKADKINESLSLYEFMITKKLNTEALFSTNEEPKKINDEVLVILNSTNYHLYHDLISNRVRLGLRDVPKETLCNGLQIYTVSDERVRGGRVVLDYYSAHDVAKYLSKCDLLNLKIAFHPNPNQSFDYVNAPAELMQQKTLNDTTAQHHTKRKR
ncbi:uncharacterized protein [Hetaerina americana]|uniref:uncharacterized protein n=1 Tax=Hetaerina americana TaxID=62018 RepID=UPI003A7F43CC